MNWSKLRKEALEQSNYICSVCETNNNLHVHHKRYPAEKLSDTLVACAQCHFKIHKKHWKINGYTQWDFETLKKLRQENKTLKEISEIFQVSRTRIRQKLKNFGIGNTHKALLDKIKTGINIKVENCEYVKRLAEKENRNFSNMLDTIIERYRDVS